MVSIIGMPQFQAPQQGYNFAPLAAGIDTIRDQRNQNKMMAFRQSEADQDRQYKNEMLKMAQAKSSAAMVPKPTAGIQEYEFAMKQQAAAGKPPVSFADWKMMNTRAGAPQNNVYNNMNEGNVFKKKYDQEMAGHYAGIRKDAISKGSEAKRQLNSLSLMENSLNDPDFYSGTGGKTVQSLKKAAQSLFGIPVRGVAAAEVVDNLSKDLALNEKSKLPGTLSNSDVQLLLSLPAGLSKTPESNRRLVQIGILQKRYEIALSQAANEYAGKNGGRLDEGFNDYLSRVEDEYGQKFKSIIRELNEQPQAQPRSPAAGVPLDALRKQYGLE